ncbi:hypothetical protein AMS68_006567 [Peltaster fructicola]|uniref:Uncharacterized protein n=1 Tax=Peltaster fructicola TaxID=286661 RepID=A0A6H0Y328_9PEZI|nr:hypothetical protein AMS68_006567 [Peltaster fructicola]
MVRSPGMASRSWKLMKGICNSATALPHSLLKAGKKRETSSAIPSNVGSLPLPSSSSCLADSMARLDGTDSYIRDHCYDSDDVEEDALDEGDMLFMSKSTLRDEVAVADSAMKDAPGQAVFDDDDDIDRTGMYRYSSSYPSDLYYDTDNIANTDDEDSLDEADMLFMPELTCRSKMGASEDAATDWQIIELFNATAVSVKVGITKGSFNVVDELIFDIQAHAMMVADSVLDAPFSPATPMLSAAGPDSEIAELSI